jgi:hypothetical protein
MAQDTTRYSMISGASHLCVALEIRHAPFWREGFVSISF